MDGEGVFQYVSQPQPLAKKPKLKPAPPYIHDTPPAVIQDMAGPVPPNMC